MGGFRKQQPADLVKDATDKIVQSRWDMSTIVPNGIQSVLDWKECELVKVALKRVAVHPWLPSWWYVLCV